MYIILTHFIVLLGIVNNSTWKWIDKITVWKHCHLQSITYRKYILIVVDLNSFRSI